MMITIRNRKLLRMLGFEPSGTGPMVAGLTLRTWLEVIWRQIKRRGQSRQEARVE